VVLFIYGFRGGNRVAMPATKTLMLPVLLQNLGYAAGTNGAATFADCET